MLTENPTAARQTLVFGTSQSVEPDRGATALLYTPGANDPSGLTKPTYFLGASLGRAVTKNLPRLAGSIAPHMRHMDQKIRVGLGFGSGPAYAQGLGTNSIRGRIVCLTSDLEKRLETGYAIVLTEHAYSGKNADQALVPLYLESDRNPYEGVPRFEKPWVSDIFDDREGPLIALGRMVFSVHQPSQIHRVLSFSVDTPDLLAIEADIEGWLFP